MNGADELVRAGLHFLRPTWLLGLPALALAALAWWRLGGGRRTGWEAHVDPELAPHVLEGVGAGGRSRPSRSPLALFAVWALACLVLSGPVLERRRVAVHDAPGTEIVLVDLSASMLADDLPPDRITRARFKLDALLERADGLEVGLVAFAERPYTVAPPTDDVATLRAFLPSLSPEIVPVPGSRPDLAIRRGVELLERAGAARGGHLLLVTDAEPDAATLEEARRARELGHALSVLGVGTPGGAPLRDARGRFVTDADGAIAVPRLDPAAPARLAEAGGGVGTVLADDAADLDALDAVRRSLAPGTIDDGVAGATRDAVWWIERGPWVVPLLALAALLPFRRRDGA